MVASWTSRFIWKPTARTHLSEWSWTLSSFYFFFLFHILHTLEQAEGEIIMPPVLLVRLFSPSHKSEWLVMYSGEMYSTTEVRWSPLEQWVLWDSSGTTRHWLISAYRILSSQWRAGKAAPRAWMITKTSSAEGKAAPRTWMITKPLRTEGKFRSPAIFDWRDVDWCCSQASSGLQALSIVHQARYYGLNGSQKPNKTFNLMALAGELRSKIYAEALASGNISILLLPKMSLRILRISGGSGMDCDDLNTVALKLTPAGPGMNSQHSLERQLCQHQLRPRLPVPTPAVKPRLSPLPPKTL